MKLNCDGAFKSNQRAIGIVARDTKRAILAVIGERCHASSALAMEFLAIRNACNLALTNGWVGAIIESDSTDVIALSSSEFMGWWLAMIVVASRISSDEDRDDDASGGQRRRILTSLYSRTVCIWDYRSQAGPDDSPGAVRRLLGPLDNAANKEEPVRMGPEAGALGSTLRRSSSTRVHALGDCAQMLGFPWLDEKQTNNKRMADDSFRNNLGHQQQPAKRQNVAKVYNMGSGERKPYGGNLTKCTKCHLYHNGSCTQKCHKCNKVGHFARDCRSSGNINVANAQRDNRANPKGNVGNVEKKGNASRDPNSNVIMVTFLLNNHYASILFDTGADRSFISTAFSSLIDIVTTSLGNSYNVELADGKIIGIRRCHTMIVYDEKLVRILYGNETLIFRDDKSNDGREYRLTIISCSKPQEYMAKGCQIFLAQISAKKEEDKSEG
nr:hypothetical protein [Tanacetum cinerariifolium]